MLKFYIEAAIWSAKSNRMRLSPISNYVDSLKSAKLVKQLQHKHEHMWHVIKINVILLAIWWWLKGNNIFYAECDSTFLFFAVNQKQTARFNYLFLRSNSRIECDGANGYSQIRYTCRIYFDGFTSIIWNLVNYCASLLHSNWYIKYVLREGEKKDLVRFTLQPHVP